MQKPHKAIKDKQDNYNQVLYIMFTDNHLIWQRTKGSENCNIDNSHRNHRIMAKAN